jgi:hypothetical protein
MAIVRPLSVTSPASEVPLPLLELELLPPLELPEPELPPLALELSAPPLELPPSEPELDAKPEPKPVGHSVAHAEHSFAVAADRQAPDGMQAPASASLGHAQSKKPVQALLTALTLLAHEVSRQLTQAAGRGSFGQFVRP